MRDPAEIRLGGRDLIDPLTMLFLGSVTARALSDFHFAKYMRDRLLFAAATSRLIMTGHGRWSERLNPRINYL